MPKFSITLDVVIASFYCPSPSSGLYNIPELFFCCILEPQHPIFVIVIMIGDTEHN
jgi:hypothetical protein